MKIVSKLYNGFTVTVLCLCQISKYRNKQIILMSFESLKRNSPARQNEIGVFCHFCGRKVSKVECVVSVVIWSEIHMDQCRADDHREDVVLLTYPILPKTPKIKSNMSILVLPLKNTLQNDFGPVQHGMSKCNQTNHGLRDRLCVGQDWQNEMWFIPRAERPEI